MITVTANTHTSATFRIAPSVGIHLPILNEMIALEIDTQMKRNLNA